MRWRSAPTGASSPAVQGMAGLYLGRWSRHHKARSPTAGGVSLSGIPRQAEIAAAGGADRTLCKPQIAKVTGRA
jgi:hypothetical protein